MGRTSDADTRLKTAALDLMWNESYGAVSIDDICRCADVKKGSFYYFFKSKSELAVAALEMLWQDQWKPRLDACFSPSVDPLTRFENYVASLYASHSERFKKNGRVLGCPVGKMGTDVTTHEADVSGKVREISARKRKYFESAIRDAMAEGEIEPGDPAQRVLAFVCLLEGALNQARILNDPEVLKTLPAAMKDILHVRSRSAAAPAASAS